MRLDRLELKNFRNYSNKTIRFHDLTAIIARNGSGKSNLLEAIYLLSTGNSPRTRVTEEMVRWESELAQVTGIILNDERRIENSEEEEEYMSLAVVLTRGKYLGKRIQMRRYLVDGAARIRSNFVGRLGVVMFRPEDLRLVEGSPSRRRQFLDDSLSQTSSIYAKALTAYEGALRRRNRILDAIRE